MEILNTPIGYIPKIRFDYFFASPRLINPLTFSATNIFGSVIRMTSLLHIYKLPQFSKHGESITMLSLEWLIFELKPKCFPDTEKS